MICTSPGLATLTLTALLAFGPFSGCGASHRGTRDGINPGGPRTPTDGPTPSQPPVDSPAEPPPSGGTPEPASLLLAAGAAVGYGVFRLKRKKPETPNPQA